MDGNDSVVSESGDLPPKKKGQVKLDKLTSAQYLPIVATYNCRSIFPKLGNVKKDILERNIQCVFCCEIWEQKENKTHKFDIENMLESDGLKYISTPRPTGWGGAAIIVNQEKFSLEKLNIHIPYNLEIIWGIMKPKDERAIFKRIIVCSFYSPPNSRKNAKLSDHIVTTLHMLSTQYPNSPIIMGADRNSMDISPIINCGLKMKQLVDKPTRRDKILDVIITNVPDLYKSPIIVPPVPCDDPTAGVPSDHHVPVCVPHTDRYSRPTRQYRLITHRPLPDTAINKFGRWITAETWEKVSSRIKEITTTQHSQDLQKLLMCKLDEFCPTETFKISTQDKPWINAELKKLKRQRMREWQRNGKTEKYEKLAKEFDQKFKSNAKKFLRKKIDDLKETQPGKVFKVLKSMGAQPGECKDETFTLQSHQTDGLTNLESAERIAEYFATISREYEPLRVSRLPDRVKARLRAKSTPPIISELDCYKKIVAAKKPQSGVPGDLPSKIIKEFSVELASPLKDLFNNILQSATWPDPWKVEYVTPISKVQHPETEDDLRPIALTPFFSKVMEQFVVMWLLEVIGDKLDIRQYGGIRGNSIQHYLIELINFILYHQDNNEPTAILLCLVDFQKAFNRQDHSILITKLSDMGVPSWLLKIVISFLTNRRMVVRYKGETSSIKELPGGGPQGALLGLLLFLILVNDIGFSDQTNENGELITSKRRIKEFNELHLKYVDDLALVEAISMKKQLSEMGSIPQPCTFHERTGHTLLPENSRVYRRLLKTEEYARENRMKINFKKTKFMVFNPGRTMDFHPRFTVNENELDVVEETRLLGLVIRNDLSWSSNTECMIKKANKKLWCLRRLKKLGAEREDLISVYQKQIRCLLEYAVAVWHPSLTSEENIRIERVQKSALCIILGQDYTSYKSALKELELESLQARRIKLCRKFAIKSQKHPKFSKWFKPYNKTTVTRGKTPKFFEAYFRTERFKKSPLSYLTSMLNSQ